MKKNIKVKKKDGVFEKFQPAKLCKSIEAVGLPNETAVHVCDIVGDYINSSRTTSENIFKVTRDFIAKVDPVKAAIYSLERGLSSLGPSGFLFEQYVAAILVDLGYKVKTNIHMNGEAIMHEVDVYAEKGNVVYIIEAKYRNEFKSKTHIDQVMYADARLQDIRRQAKKTGNTQEFYTWLVTNTRFTNNAKNYVRFRDMQLLGWDFPRYINLMKIAYDKKLFPVTVLPSITERALKQFSHKKIVLIKDLYGKTEYQLRDEFNLSLRLSKKISLEIEELMEA